MSARILGKVVRLKLPPTEKLVLLVIANYINDASGDAWPSQNTLASDTGLARQTVNKAISRLVKKGILTSCRRSKDGKLTSNIYRINTVAVIDTEGGDVAQNDNTLSISDRQACLGELHNPLGTLIEPLDSGQLAIEGKSETATSRQINRKPSPTGPPRTPAEFLSLPRSLQEYYSLNRPDLMASLKHQGFTWDRFTR
jgi:biotin operon repressor